MKIKNIKINAYGKLENKDLKFEDGINIIHGLNESGKSTLLNFISSSLYGISKNKEGKNISDYEKFKPWNNNEFSGKIKYQLDNNKIFEVFRDFNKKNPIIYNENMDDITNNFEIDKKEGSKFFVEQTKLDKTMYLSTVVSMQEEVRLNEKEQSNLIQKISNLTGTGEDNVSYKKIISKLQDKIRDEIGTSKTSLKPINILENEIKEENRKINELLINVDKKFEIDSEKEKINNQIIELRKKINIYHDLLNISQTLNDSENEIKIREKQKTNETDKINEITELQNKTEKELRIKQEELNKLKLDLNKKEEIKQNTIKDIEIFKETKMEKEIKRKFDISIIIMSILSILVTIISIGFKKYYGLIIAVLVCIASITKYFKTLKTNKEFIKNRELEKNKRIKELDENKAEAERELEKLIQNIEYKNNEIIEITKNEAMLKGQIDLIKRNLEQISIELEQINTDRNILKIKQYEDIKSKYKNIINNVDDIIENGNFKMCFEEANKEINEKIIEEKGLKFEYDSLNPKIDELVKLKENLEFNIKEVDELKEKEKCIMLAIDILKIAYDKMKETITPKFTNNLSQNIRKITEGKYKKVNLNNNNELVIENERGEYVGIEKLSTGTIDQLYLSLRLSMIKEISNEKLPIILDETFAYFDNERLKNIIEYLNNEFIENQILIFTCTNREKEMLDKLNIKFNMVEM